MATPRAKRSDRSSDSKNSSHDIKRLKDMIGNVDSMISDMELSLYGTKTRTDGDDITSKFNSMMRDQLDAINHQGNGNVSSFMAQLFDNDMKRDFYNSKDLSDIFSEDSGMLSYLSEEYQTKASKYEDLKEVSTQLIELNEAILIMRDSIISADTTEGTVSRTIEIDGDTKSSTAIVEAMEKKFDLKKKIKNTIVANTLRFGEYYAYVLPYSELFAKFRRRKNDPSYSTSTSDLYHESTLYDRVYENHQSTQKPLYIKENVDIMWDNLSDSALVQKDDEKFVKTELESGFNKILKRITICNESCPIPFLEEGAPAMEALYEDYKEKNPEKDKFNTVHNIENGSYSSDNNKKSSKDRAATEFKDIKDCYIKFIDPMHLFPIKIMKNVIGYCYIHEENSVPINGFFGSNFRYAEFGKYGKDKTIVDRIASKIVKSFDKKFLDDNLEMKETIAEALMYFDLNNKKLRFQFIPAEYICPFIINENEDGNGVSVVEPSLFYAKLYLLLLLFKITSIVLYSNDTKVNYIRTSGIDKNIANKIQQIARDKQKHTVNIMDMMSYSSLLKKIGRGSEQYIPTGRNNERGLETEILQGQDVQTNSDLMELLRTSYILGTGVPSAIMNYLNEADFAKSIEVANTRFLGRILSLQLDFNDSISKFYRMIAKYSTSIDDDTINNIKIILTQPKQANNNIKQEAISGFDTLKDFLLRLFFGDDYQSAGDTDEKEMQKEFIMYITDKYLSSIVDIEDLKKKYSELEINKVYHKLDPTRKDTSDIDDLGDMMSDLQ